ncbi:tartronate semialdehyde reductase [Actibacterium pelagium]|uniref:Tartronate semialdehyde reductase n=2 Tax=Actibacterium pelagium TaxID=2029103 RepID=A0A917ELR2_9RHOB|nr:tartronate semialdehyde reductase [Actibacterium pelagium]
MAEGIAERIGVAGLGRMGQAIAESCAKAGYSVAGWTRSGVTPEAAQALGIAPCQTLAELAAGSDIVILSLFDDAAVSEVLGQLVQANLSGKLVVDTSTVSPGTLRAAEAAVNVAGALAVDAPISGGPEMVRGGVSGVFMGGAEEAVQRFAPVAAILSDKAAHIGDLGQGLAAKIVNNTVIGGYLEILKEAVQTGKRAGLTMEAMMGLLSKSPVANPFLMHRLPVLLGEEGWVGFAANGARKDAILFWETADALGVEAPALKAYMESATAFVEEGGGEEDVAMIVRSAYLNA